MRPGPTPRPSTTRASPSQSAPLIHRIPDSHALEDGNIINIDVFISGHYGDCSETYLVTKHPGHRDTKHGVETKNYDGIGEATKPIEGK